MGATGFTNSFTCGEVTDGAWDRTDLQPVSKGCQQALNYVVTVLGPLRKRRGFWLVSPTLNQAVRGRMIPFRKSLTSAFVIELGNLTARVWNIDGTPLLNGGVQVTFTTPYTTAQIASLNYKQIADVIEFRCTDGSAPQALSHNSDASWTFAGKTYPNGPWLPENITATTITVSGAGGSQNWIDTNTPSAQGAIVTGGGSVTLTASAPLFSIFHVGATFRLRAGAQTTSTLQWAAITKFNDGNFLSFNGQIYLLGLPNGTAGQLITGNNPPVHVSGSASDGAQHLFFIHDGAGVVQITGFTDSTHVTATVVRNLPIPNGVATTYWSQCAYSLAQGWPTATPELREERLAEGAASNHLDFLDLTQTAGFSPGTEDFTPGLGTGAIVATNAIRARVGVDGGQVLHYATATYLVGLTTTGEYLIAGSVLDEPLSPVDGLTVKRLSGYGSFGPRPVEAHAGLLFICRGGQTLREIRIDTQQGAAGEDHSYLATHIAGLGLYQLAWVAQPDEVCWARTGPALANGLAAYTYHAEQQVKGWTRQQLGTSTVAGWAVEDMIVMPGPGGLETLWLMVARNSIPFGVQRMMLMQSRPSDALFMDFAASYAGAPAATLTGLPFDDGDVVDVLSDQGWFPGQVVTGGATTLPAAVVTAQAGYTYPADFISLKLDLRIYNGALLQRQSINSAIVDILTANAQVGLNGGLLETVSTRLAGDTPGAVARRITKEVTVVAGDGPGIGGERDPRLRILDQTPYDGAIYAIKENGVSLGD